AALSNLHASLQPKGRLLVTNNYDINSVPAALEHRLAPSNALSAYSTLLVYENMLWLDPEAILPLAANLGFASASVLNVRELGDGRRMFDLLLAKSSGPGDPG